MNSADVAVLPTVTDALTNLRNQGLPLNVDIQHVSMLVNGKQVQYSWDPSNNGWQITAQ